MLSTLKIVKVKLTLVQALQMYFGRKDVPIKYSKKPRKGLDKIYVMVDGKEYASSKSPMEISIVPGKRNIRMSAQSFKLAAVKNFFGETIQWAGGDRDAFLVGEYLKFDASDVLSMKGANIFFEEGKNLTVYVVNTGSRLIVLDVEEE